MSTSGTTSWFLEGTGYEFCNCQHGCGCNFGGFPNSEDGSCQAFVGAQITRGACGDVKLDGLSCAMVVVWPKAIHQGGGRCVFIVEPETTEAQIGALAQIFTGQLGGLPWELLGTTFEVVGLEKARLTFGGSGINATIKADGFGQARGRAFKNPVTGEEHHAIVELPDGFIWSRGECGTGAFEVKAGPLHLAFADTNWIRYEFSWSNRKVAA